MPEPQRLASVIRVRPDRVEEYVQLHSAVWPEVLEALRQAHMTNYSIYLHGDLLFSYVEYRGSDLTTDLASIADDPATKRWWSLTGPMQETLRAADDEDWWLPIGEVFHLE